MTTKEAKQFKVHLSIRLMELGNLLFAGVVVSQTLEKGKRSLFLIIFGSIIGVLPYFISYLIRK